MKNNSNSIIIINRSSPELDNLAAGLAKENLLNLYIRPYSNQNRFWERKISKINVFNSIYNQTIGKRKLPKGLKSSIIYETGVLPDFIFSFFQHFSNRPAQLITKIAENLLVSDLRKEAEIHSIHANIIVGSYSISETAFNHTSGMKILNYPSVHHELVKRIYVEEKELEPAFASMLEPNWDVMPEKIIDLYNSEIELSDKVLLGSNFSKKSFIDEGISPSKLICIPYGTDTSLFSPPIVMREKSNKYVVLFVGRINQFKGISYLLKSYRKIKGNGTNLLLVGNIEGDYHPLSPFLEDFIHIPHMPRKQLSRIYQGADVFVFPTLHEGMGLVVLEAMASGLPIITTPNGPGDLVRDGIDGFLVPIRNVDSIAEKLEFLRNNPDTRLKMGNNARERALNFTWECYQQKVVSFIKSLQ